jgi:NAD(P)-dependent dehydrogenase (short-subunit alcohol dehydrogenase family)
MSGSVAQKTILVTGSTDGIGKQTALSLARMGATVLLHGRDAHRGEAALKEITAATGNGRLDYFSADFASMRQVRELARNIQERYDSLDVLINNAGVYMNTRVLTEDGCETTFAVNHLAPFLLTHLLLDLLNKRSQARIITVSSVAHQRGRFEPGNLQGEESFSPYGAYALSKLANVLFTVELAVRMQGTGVTANCLHPGVIGTKLLRKGFSITGDSLEAGAETPVFLATSPAVEGLSGRYFLNRKEVRLSPHAVDARDRMQLWYASEKLVGLR